jgi:Zn-finger nucleic acid-binding protein
MLGCGRCGGQWLDGKGSLRVLSGSLSDQAKAMARSASQKTSPKQPAHGDYRAPQPGHRARTCPICSQTLTPRTITEAALEIDVCERDGTWFDAHELERLARHAELKAAIIDAEAADEIRHLEEFDQDQRRRRRGNDILATAIVRGIFG